MPVAGRSSEVQPVALPCTELLHWTLGSGDFFLPDIADALGIP